MAKTIAFDLNLNVGDTEKKIKEFISSTDLAKTKLRELERAAIEASINGNKALSETFAKAAGELKDEIEDTRQSINNFSSDTQKLDVAVGAVQGLVGGFTAVAGAVGLMAGENEDLQRILTKVTSSLALLNGVQQVANTLNRSSATGAFLYAAANKALAFAVGTSTGALKVFRVALISTGIGAAVVALGLLVANFEKVKDVIVSLFPSLEKLGELFQKATDFVGFTSAAGRLADSLRAVDEVADQNFKNRIKVLEAQGEQESAIFKLRKEKIESDIDRINKIPPAQLTPADLSLLKDLETEYEILLIEYEKYQDTLREDIKKAEAETIENQKKIAEIKKEVTDTYNKATYEQIKLARKVELDLITDTYSKERELLGDKYKSELSEARKNQGEQLIFLKGQLNLGIINKKKYNEEEKKVIDQFNKLKLDIEKSLVKEWDLIKENETKERIKKLKEADDLEIELLKGQLEGRLSIIKSNRLKQEILNKSGELTPEQIKSFNDQELEILQDKFDAELITEEDYLTQKKALNDKYTSSVLEREKSVRDAIIQGAQSVLSILSDLSNANFNNIKATTDEELSVLENRYTKEREAAEGNANLQSDLDKRYEQEKKAILTRQQAAERKAFEDNKKLQIAEALISTYAATQTAFAQASKNPITTAFPAYPFIQAGLSLAAGLSRVALIKSTQYSGGSVGSVGAGGGGGGSTPTTPTNPFSSQGSSSVINPELRGRGERDVRVYVLESDISTTQRRVSVIENNSNASF